MFTQLRLESWKRVDVAAVDNYWPEPLSGSTLDTETVAEIGK